jgi:hypothetical protein
VLVSLSLTALTACAGGEEKADDKPTQTATAGDKPKGAKRLPADEFDASAHQRRDLDLNKDGLPDAYQFSAKDAEGDYVVARKEVDVNFDGRIDLIRNFTPRGDLLNERLDHDFDGRIDVVNIFEKGVIVRKEYDTNFDGNVDLWRYFDDGTISRKEADLTHDGAVDYWEYYEGGKLDRIGIDRDSDGEVDEWEVNSEES